MCSLQAALVPLWRTAQSASLTQNRARSPNTMTDCLVPMINWPRLSWIGKEMPPLVFAFADLLVLEALSVAFLAAHTSSPPTINTTSVVLAFETQ